MSNELKFLSGAVAKGRMSRRDFMGRAAALGVTAASANALLSTAARAEGPVRGGVLKAGIQGGESTNSLDPATFASSVPLTFGRAWGETLVTVDRVGKLDFRILEGAQPSADATTWTFPVRKDIEFHNGKTVTPDDVLATLERHADEESKSGALGLLQAIEGMKTDGDNVVITLESPNADLPYLLADYHLIVQPNGGKDAPDAGISAGPYKVVVNEPGVRHGGERFENYWAPDKGGFADQIEIVVINDATARTAALQSGQVHMINRVEPKVVSLVKRLPGVTIENVSGRGHYVFIMHCNTAPFDNNELRLALKYAMNRQEMVDKILFGYGSVGNDFPINGAYPLFSDDIPQREFDLEKAAEHYRNSGNSDPIVLRTSDVAFPGAVDAAQLFQQSCSQAGIPLEIKREPGDGYWSEVWNAQPFCTSYWGGRPVQDQMYSTAYLSSADWNDTRFFNSTFDQTIVTARAELDEDKRRALYRDAALMVRDEGGLILPMFNDFIDALSNDVGGWDKDINGELMNNYALAQCWLNNA